MFHSIQVKNNIFVFNSKATRTVLIYSNLIYNLNEAAEVRMLNKTLSSDML